MIKKFISWLRSLFFEKPLTDQLRAVTKVITEKMTIYDLVRVCPGGRHAWYNSSIGLVRKPYNGSSL